MRTNQVIELGNIVHTGNWSSAQRGRIYSAEGIAPCCNCCGGRIGTKDFGGSL